MTCDNNSITQLRLNAVNFFVANTPRHAHFRTKVEFSTGREVFYYTGQHGISKGFTCIMPWLAVDEKNLPQLAKGEKMEISKVELYEVKVENFVSGILLVHAGRRLVPTTLGITLIRGYQTIDPDLCLPDICSFIEQQITLIAKGQANHSCVVEHVLQQFRQKYSYFVKQIENMNALFEAQFPPLADSGRLLTKCGKCTRYMKYISVQPSRLYCGTCEEVYNLPQKGTIKLYKELVCPLDNFELLIFSMAGPEGKSFPLCPYCYNNPPFEGIDTLFSNSKTSSSGKIGKGAGMPCFMCSHPTCQHSVIVQGVCACPECDGTLVLDPVSGPKWHLYCNMCNCLVFLPQGAHWISTTRDRCVECDSIILGKKQGHAVNVRSGGGGGNQKSSGSKDGGDKDSS
ncbi:hypothetical protein IFM89_023110 [Coptis chinensis]|uniref:DNA topoisomerase n=1 Tax=Coptis chinensis TaxID=261450 RepID=A0A835HXQ4_9MAGN|nr:hypothetical protein IFM89_023110 [Coptis chinensis]